MKSRKSAAIKRNNQASNSTSTSQNPASTSKVSTREDRTDIRIPKNSKIYQFLYVDTAEVETPKWRRLDALLTRAEENTADQAALIYDEFVARIGVYFPEKIGKIEKLRALILWHILFGDDLPETYWGKIREL